MIIATYARYSSDKQREASIPDQERGHDRWAAQHGGSIDPALRFRDQAMSGARHDRPGYRAMLAAAGRQAFDVLLIDEFTRLGRDLGESWQTIKRLKFHGVRVVGVVDGTDTARKGYKLETGFRGLIAEHYLDDLAEKTHRGLTGQALAGYSAGGLPYGYDSVPDGDRGFLRRINPEQAAIVRTIYELAATGLSPRRIAAELNRRGVPSPRGRTWAMSAVYGDRKRGLGILGNPIYTGRVIWNRSQWVKDPETGKRRRIERPESDWIVQDVPELRIVSDELWNAAGARPYGRNGSAHYGQGPKYLFSGLLACGSCGGRYVMVDRYRYGCATHRDRGTCENRLCVPRSLVESRLLKSIKRDLLSDECFQEFERTTRELLQEANRASDIHAIEKRRDQVTAERDNILAAIRAGIITPSTKAALEEAERTIAQHQAEIDAAAAFQPSTFLPRAREIYQQLAASLETIEDVGALRAVLREIVGEEIRLMPEDGILIAEVPAMLAGIQQSIRFGSGGRI